MKYILGLLFFVMVAFSADLKVGENLEFKVFKDQFEEQLIVNSQTKKLIVAFSKESGEVVKSKIESNKSYLEENNAIYLADVSSVPGFVMSFFMLPKFKKYEYKMGLLEDEKKVLYFPKKDEKITVIELENFIVKSINFVDKLD